MKEACRKSLENGHTAFCDGAGVVCCELGAGNVASCNRDFYERVCTEFPFPGTCDHAADSCCGSRDSLDQENADVMWANSQCLCDYYTYTSSFLGLGANTQEDGCDVSDGFNCHCSVAANHQITAQMTEKVALEKLYEETRGYYWTNKTAWKDDRVPHCERFGVACNEEGSATEINLRNNNLQGGLPIGTVDTFAELTILDLAENNFLSSINATKFHKLRNLTHVDISMNKFVGHADLYFSSATTYANYSWNRFNAARFKKFSTPFSTMQVVDLSYNRISMPAIDLLRNIPLSVNVLKLSNNTLSGKFPNSTVLWNLTHFEIANNAIEGGIYYFGNSKKLTILDLSGNKLSQDIPPEIGYLNKLTVLNLTGNALGGTIPASLGRLGR